MSASPRLHVVASSHDLQKDKLVDGLGENRPTQRKQLIFDQLQSHASHITTHLLPPSTSPPSLSLAHVVHHPAYLSFLTRAWPEWQAHLSSHTADLYMSADMKRTGGDTAVFLPGQIAPRDLSSLPPPHSPQQQQATADLTRPGSTIFSQICYYGLDRLTPIQAHTLTDLSNDLRVIDTAISLIPPPPSSTPTPPSSSPPSSSPPYIYAMTTQPGHHASTSTFGGYCYVNNAAVAAALLVEKGYARVGVLDVDYHAGNGTVQIFYQRPDVLVATLHCDPDVDYPYNCGYADHTGQGEGEGYTINRPLPPKTDWASYKTHLSSIIARFHACNVGAVVVSVGVDTVLNDPECAPLAGFALTQPDYVEMGRMIRQMQLPTVFVQEGGYKLDEVAALVRNIVLPDYE